MTTMARPSVLLLCVVMGLFTTVHSQLTAVKPLKPLKDAIETTTSVVIPCGARCVVQSYREVLEAVNKCVILNTGLMMEVNQYLQDNNLNGDSGNGPTYQQIYNAMFSEGRSPLCGWYRKYGGCFEKEFGRICGSGVLQALTGLKKDFDAIICSKNPNYVACVTHPSLFGDIQSPTQTNTSPYAMCATALANNFMNVDYDNYYNNVILRENGGFLFRALRTFGNCLGDAVKTVTVSPPTGCAVVGEDIKKYINDGLDYFHFGQSGKDYVKCFAKPTLHNALTECGQAFESDLRTIYGDSFLTQLNTTLFIGAYSGLQQPYRKLSTCFKTALNQNCGSEPDSVALVDRFLHPLDHLFGLRSDNPTYCSASGPITPRPPVTPAPPVTTVPTVTAIPAVTSLKPFKDAFEVTTEVVVPCGSRCVVKSYRDVLSAANTCIMASTGIVMEVEQYLRDNNLHDNPTYQQIYDAMFSEGRSPLCRWYRKYGGCFEREFGRVCGRGVMGALTGLVQDFEQLVCSQSPNYLSCVTHPSLSIGDNNPYGRCAQSMIALFQNIDYDNYYEQLIINDRGSTLFTTLRTFGNCIGDAIKTVRVSPPTGCTVVGEHVKKYVNDGLDYFHFGQGGKDYLKCFASPALHTDLRRCGAVFGTDLEALFGVSVWEQLNATLFRGGYRVLQQPYTRLSGCFKNALDINCRSETDSVALVDRILHPLDHVFGVRRDDPTYCDNAVITMTVGTTTSATTTSATTTSAAGMSVGSLGLILYGLFVFLSTQLPSY